jgi:hypothetical protein
MQETQSVSDAKRDVEYQFLVDCLPVSAMSLDQLMNRAFITVGEDDGNLGIRFNECFLDHRIEVSAVAADARQRSNFGTGALFAASSAPNALLDVKSSVATGLDEIDGCRHPTSLKRLYNFVSWNGAPGLIISPRTVAAGRSGSYRGAVKAWMHVGDSMSVEPWMHVKT